MVFYWRSYSHEGEIMFINNEILNLTFSKSNLFSHALNTSFPEPSRFSFKHSTSSSLIFEYKLYSNPISGVSSWLWSPSQPCRWSAILPRLTVLQHNTHRSYDLCMDQGCRHAYNSLPHSTQFHNYTKARMATNSRPLSEALIGITALMIYGRWCRLSWRFRTLVLRFCRMWRSYLSTILTQVCHVWRSCSSPCDCAAQLFPLHLLLQHHPFQLSHPPTFTTIAHDSIHVTWDTTVRHWEYTSRSPFLPFLTLHITIRTNVSRSLYSSCSSINSFRNCPYWLWLVVRVIPSDSYDVFFSHFPLTYLALHYLPNSPVLYSLIFL